MAFALAERPNCWAEKTIIGNENQREIEEKVVTFLAIEKGCYLI